tara:strand:- start:386 stop:601 length:216 start_codon:yes stop_codon:yes gene_type:complete
MNAKLSPINDLNGIIPSLHTPFKNKVAEEIFSTYVCRGNIQEFDEAQRYEAEFHIDNILNLQKKLLNKNNK